MMVVAALEHHARRLVNVVTHALATKASGFSNPEAGDYLDASDARCGAWGDGHMLADDCSLMTSAGNPPPADAGPAAGGPDTPAAGVPPYSIEELFALRERQYDICEECGHPRSWHDQRSWIRNADVCPEFREPLSSWHGWAVPAILDVLAAHRVHEDDADNIIRCRAVWNANYHATFSSWTEWREHVAPLIADRIACDPARAAAALATHQPPK